MGLFDGLVKSLKSLGKELDVVAKKGGNAARNMGVASQEISKSTDSIKTGLIGLRGEAAKTGDFLASAQSSAEGSFRSMGAAHNDFAASVTTKNKEIERGARDSSRKIEQETKKSITAMDELFNKTKSMATPLDDLLFRLKDVDSIWVETLRAWVDMLKAGEITMDQFQRRFGHMVVSTEDGVKRISTLITGLSPDQVLTPVENTVLKLKEHGRSVEQLMEDLANSTSQYGQALLGLVEALRNGEISMKMFLQQIEQAKRAAGPESEISRLADDLSDAVTQGLL